MTGVEADNPWLYVVGLLITSGLAKYGLDLLKEHRARQRAMPPPSAQRQQEVDASIVTMARVNEELEGDNNRLRQVVKDLTEQMQGMVAQMAVERAQHASDRAAWQREVEALEERLRVVRAEHESQYTVLLEQVRALRERTDTSTPPKGIRP